MKRFFTVGLGAATLAAVFAAGLFTGISHGQEKSARSSAKLVMSEPLPNVPGKRLTALMLTYAPGDASPSHRHAGSVFAYVLSGEVRSEVSGMGPARVYRAGEAFFEPPGSTHAVSENASKTEPASLLAVFVADEGAELTTTAQ